MQVRPLTTIGNAIITFPAHDCLLLPPAPFPLAIPLPLSTMQKSLMIMPCADTALAAAAANFGNQTGSCF